MALPPLLLSPSSPSPFPARPAHTHTHKLTHTQTYTNTHKRRRARVNRPGQAQAREPGAKEADHNTVKEGRNKARVCACARVCTHVCACVCGMRARETPRGRTMRTKAFVLRCGFLPSALRLRRLLPHSLWSTSACRCLNNVEAVERERE